MSLNCSFKTERNENAKNIVCTKHVSVHTHTHTHAHIYIII